jgi:hypothetical protein
MEAELSAALAAKAVENARRGTLLCVVFWIGVARLVF